MAIWTVEKCLAISQKMWADKDQWRDLLSESYEYALPDRNPYHDNGTGLPQGRAGSKGKDKSSRRVFDSTLMNDASKLANRLQYELFPIGHEWGNLTPGPFIPDGQKDAAKKELAQMQKILFAAIHLSNFDLAIAEWLLDWVVAGTAVMLVQKGDDDNPVIYSAIPQAHVAFREGAFGSIDAMSRKHRKRVDMIKAHWPDAQIGNLQKMVQDAKDDEAPEIDLIELNYYDYDDKVWRYTVIAKAKDGKTDNEMIVKREYISTRLIVSRFSKAAGEAQGRSLVMQALPDARVLSSIKNYLLRQAALAVGGVFMVKNSGVINPNNVRIFPGAMIPVQATGGPAGASISPLPVGGDLQLAQLVIEDLVNSIHKIMLNTGIPEVNQGVRSATEWIERIKDLQQSIGSPFARCLKEGIVPIIEATFAIMGELQLIQMPEEGRIKVNSGQIKLQFTSPLVQGQNTRDVENLANAVSTTRELFGEQVAMLNFKAEDAGAYVADKFGVDPKLIRDQGEREKMQQQAGAIAAAQQGGGVAPNAQIPPTAATPQPVAA